MKKFITVDIQKVLRNFKIGNLDEGEALDFIMGLIKQREDFVIGEDDDISGSDRDKKIYWHMNNIREFQRKRAEESL